MRLEVRAKGTCVRSLQAGVFVACMLMGASGLQASTMTLWSNGVPENTMTGNQCDSVCNGQTWTVFDNFTVATSKN